MVFALNRQINKQKVCENNYLLCTSDAVFVKYQAQGGFNSNPRVHFYCKIFQFGKPIYADYFLEALYGLSQGLQIFLSVSHYTTVRGPEILRNWIVSGYVTFYEINKFFLNTLFFYYYIKIHYFFIINKMSSWAGEMSWRAGFGPRAVVWRPWSNLTPIILYTVIIKRCYAFFN